MNVFKIPRKVINRLRNMMFAKRFEQFHYTSWIGTKGYGRKCLLVGTKRMSIGKTVYLSDGTELLVYEGGHLTIGDRVCCSGGRLRITCAESIVLQDNVLLAPDIYITDHNHSMDPRISEGYQSQPLIVRPVVIEEGVWLGQRVCVLPGVTIGAHSIVGAQSVVTHSIPPYSIAVGAPARVIKTWDFQAEAWKSV